MASPKQELAPMRRLAKEESRTWALIIVGLVIYGAVKWVL